MSQLQASCQIPSFNSHENEPCKYTAHRTSQSSVRNRDVQLKMWHSKRDVTFTEKLQLYMSSIASRFSLLVGTVPSARRSLLLQSAHGTPTLLAALDGLFSYPYHLFNIVAYHKSNIMDVGLTRMFCDMTHEFYTDTRH